MNIIFDIDGTLMNIEHRRHFVSGSKKDWKSFVDNIKHDTPNYPVVNILEQLSDNAHIYDAVFYFLTGRNEAQREITQDQIQGFSFNEENFPRIYGIKDDIYRIYDCWEEILLMRPDGDYRPDAELKSELFDKLLNIKFPRFEDADLYIQRHEYENEYNEAREEDIFKFKKDTIIFDDRQSVVDMWRARGLTCFQVAEGDF